MKHSRRTWAIVAAVLAASLVPGARVFAAPDDTKPADKPEVKQDAKPEAKKEEAKPAPVPAPKEWTINGLVDWYYQYSFNHPPVGSTIAGRSFDIKNDQFAFNLFEVNVVRAPTDKIPVGMTATFTLGKTADLVHATEPDGLPLPANGVNQSAYKYLQQIYGTYIVGSKKPLTIDFGKFVTHMGYEVIESASNDHYSRSFLFNYAIPFYHAGLRFSYPITPTLNGQVHIVNGWNNVQDDNGGKSIGVQLNWNPSPKWNVIFNYMGGDEFTGAALPANLNTQMFDLVGIWKPTDKLKLGLNLDYGDAGKEGVMHGHWSGQAIYGRYQFTPKVAGALRLEHFEDTSGFRTGAAQNLNEVTATFECAVNERLLHRLEFRHDHAGTKFFPSGAGGAFDQDTFTFSQVIKF